jgi:hypothetical protein
MNVRFSQGACNTGHGCNIPSKADSNLLNQSSVVLCRSHRTNQDLRQFSRSVLGNETKTYGPLFNHNYDQTQQANGAITVTGFPMLSFLLHVPQTTANGCIPATEIAGTLVVSHIRIP